MNQLYLDICSVLAASLWGHPLNVSEHADWEKIFSEMCCQGVSALPGDLLESLPISADLSERWNSSVLLSFYHYIKLTALQSEVSVLLDQGGIQWAVLKGCAAAMYYPVPSYRIIGDIDILVAQDQLDAAVQLLLEAGFVRIKQDIEPEGSRHFSFVKDGLELELHRYYPRNLTRRQNIELHRTLTEGLNHAEETTSDLISFNALPTFENGLVLLQHIAHHLENGIGLRHVLDFLVYAAAVFRDIPMRTRFFEYLETSELKTLAHTVLRIGIVYFGLDESLFPGLTTDDSLCETVLFSLFEEGDFGLKTKSDSTQSVDITQVLLGCRGGIRGWWQYLQHAGEKNWALLKKHPRLKPFSRFYQFFRYIRQGLHVSHPFRTLVNSYQTNVKKRRLLKSLNLYHINQK